MGKLIDVNELKKRYPIMENDFGMVINEGLHKELDKIPPVEAIPLSVIDNIKAEIDRIYWNGMGLTKIHEVIDKNIEEYKNEKENKNMWSTI